MCVIVYKPSGAKMPSRKIVDACFKANPDGAGYMLPFNGKVVIRKGFMTFDAFVADIQDFVNTNEIDPISTPIVMHFRISTQGGVQQGLCHPFPVCDNYDEMRKLETTAQFGIAHNGIISMCTEYRSSYYYGHNSLGIDDDGNVVEYGGYRQPDYNDTMTFIKNYASLILDGDDYWAKNPNKVLLLERLLGSTNKFAVMNSKGYVKLLGHFHLRDGIYYSNLYFAETPKTASSFAFSSSKKEEKKAKKNEDQLTEYYVVADGDPIDVFDSICDAIKEAGKYAKENPNRVVTVNKVLDDGSPSEVSLWRHQGRN